MILNEKNTLVEDVFNSFGGPTVGANIDPITGRYRFPTPRHCGVVASSSRDRCSITFRVMKRGKWHLFSPRVLFCAHIIMSIFDPHNSTMLLFLVV